MRLDRLISKWSGKGRRTARALIHSGEVTVNETVIKKDDFLVGNFDQVFCGAETVQARVARYLMLWKPAGIVCATRDAEHTTVIDLIDETWAGELHLAGRLDRSTTGFVILTNDSRFSESLTLPEKKVGKRYLVAVDGEIGPDVTLAFEKGMWFDQEAITTAPAVELLDANRCRLTIYEGKHHQIKRMFARFGLRVTNLHREALGPLMLDAELKPGAWRFLTETEMANFGVEI